MFIYLGMGTLVPTTPLGEMPLPLPCWYNHGLPLRPQGEWVFLRPSWSWILGISEGYQRCMSSEEQWLMPCLETALHNTPSRPDEAFIALLPF